jgi:hypothetical protein
VRERAKVLVEKGVPAPKDDDTLPLNAVLPQTTLGVTSEGFQDALSLSIFGGGMLPPNHGVDKMYKAEVGLLRVALRVSSVLVCVCVRAAAWLPAAMPATQ